ncbi:hypothetical protein BCV69DRAFT_35770 [Microstroma glucosiphilum]|uniref:Uncharacterized protein n=1 Tax=Pseudomicrostroma glucosiphilum TaxID=1684307 RepID=A0A316U5V5_9BASI|nr:hypothetical protein BCV69DRAFT_35770 [Pseudomicrostroma glucosiphilum]PWN19841.1 hypothetical protein BCV69DRAFT_35770 [Pseudomicrostroma glucosiphilum]
MKCYKIFVLVFFVLEGVAALPSPPDGLLRADGFPSSSRADAGDSATKQARRREEFARKAKRPDALIEPRTFKASEEADSDDSDRLKRPSPRTIADLHRRQEKSPQSSLRIQDEDVKNERQLQAARQGTDDNPLAKRGKLVKGGIAVVALGTVGGLYGLLKKFVFDKKHGKPDEGPYPQPGDSSSTPPPTPRSLDDDGPELGKVPLSKRDRQGKVVKSGIAVAALATIGGLYGLLKKFVFDKKKGKPDEGPYPQPGDSSPTPPPTPRSVDDESQDNKVPLAKRDRRARLIKEAKVGAGAATIAALYYALYKLMTGKSDGQQTFTPGNDAPGPDAAPAPKARGLIARDDEDFDKRIVPGDDGAMNAQRRLTKRAITLQQLHTGAKASALVISLGGLYYVVSQILKDSKARRQGQQGHHGHAPEPVSAPAPRPRSLGDSEVETSEAEEAPRQESDLELNERGMSGAQKGFLRIGGATTAMMTMTSLAHVAQKQKHSEHKQEKEITKAKGKAQHPPPRHVPILRPRSLSQGTPCLTSSNHLYPDGARLDERLKGNWGKTVGGGVVGMCGLGMESLYAANALKKKEERQQRAYQEAKKYGPALMIKKPAKDPR